MAATGNEAASIAQTAKALGVEAQTSGATGGEAVKLSQLKKLRDSLTSGAVGFTGTATVHIDGSSIGYAYIDESYQLVKYLSGGSDAVNLTVPVPQIMFVQTQGVKSGEMSISGDYTLIRGDPYPQGRTIYIFGDVTATGI